MRGFEKRPRNIRTQLLPLTAGCFRVKLHFLHVHPEAKETLSHWQPCMLRAGHDRRRNLEPKTLSGLMSSKKQSDKPEKQNLRMPKQNLPGKPQSAIPQAEAIGKPPNPQSAGGLGLAVNRPGKTEYSNHMVRLSSNSQHSMLQIIQPT